MDTIFFLINPSYFIFGLLVTFSGLFSFYHDKYNRTEIDFKMPLFMGIMITWKEVAFANLIWSVPYFFFDRFILVNFDNWLKQKLYILQRRYA